MELIGACSRVVAQQMVSPLLLFCSSRESAIAPPPYLLLHHAYIQPAVQTDYHGSGEARKLGQNGRQEFLQRQRSVKLQ